MLRIDPRTLLLTLAGLCCGQALTACKKHHDTVSVGAGVDAGMNGTGGSGSKRLDGGTSSGGKGGSAAGGHSGSSSSKRDGGPLIDIDASGATTDAAVLGLDAALDLPDGSLILADSAILLPDGEIIDVDAAVTRYTPEIDVSTCQVGENETWSAKVDISDEGGFALVAGQTGFGLAYRRIGQGNCAAEVGVAHIPATFGFPEPHVPLSDCSVVRDVGLLGTPDGWRLAWVDNITDSNELSTIALDLDMNVSDGETRRRLTDNDQIESRPVMASIHGNAIAGWITSDPETQAARITTQALDGDAQALELVGADQGQQPRALAIAQMGTKFGALGWVGARGKPGVWLMKLDEHGAAAGDPTQLTDRVAVSSSIDLANRSNGGGAIYSIEIDGLPQVRFRRLDDHGEPIADERSIVGPPLRAQSASIATIGGGYAVAYRALPGGDVIEPEVRLTFITKEGNTLRDANGQLISFSLGSATEADARTSVSVSVEGEIMVAWLDGDPNSPQNLLKVVRRRLDCQ